MRAAPAAQAAICEQAAVEPQALDGLASLGILAAVANTATQQQQAAHHHHHHSASGSATNGEGKGRQPLRLRLLALLWLARLFSR